MIMTMVQINTVGACKGHGRPTEPRDNNGTEEIHVDAGVGCFRQRGDHSIPEGVQMLEVGDGGRDGEKKKKIQ